MAADSSRTHATAPTPRSDYRAAPPRGWSRQDGVQTSFLPANPLHPPLIFFASSGAIASSVMPPGRKQARPGRTSPSAEPGPKEKRKPKSARQETILSLFSQKQRDGSRSTWKRARCSRRPAIGSLGKGKDIAWRPEGGGTAKRLAVAAAAGGGEGGRERDYSLAHPARWPGAFAVVPPSFRRRQESAESEEKRTRTDIRGVHWFFISAVSFPPTAAKIAVENPRGVGSPLAHTDHVIAPAEFWPPRARCCMREETRGPFPFALRWASKGKGKLRGCFQGGEGAKHVPNEAIV
ncbi:hypothetical protein MRX96_043407 [Rhipicephalus microplus]